MAKGAEAHRCHLLLRLTRETAPAALSSLNLVRTNLIGRTVQPGVDGI